jgi:hypothetical protein
MGYNRQDGQWADTEELSLHASAARTASGNGDAVESGDRGTLRLLLDVTDVSGTAPSLLVILETSLDGVTWREFGAFSALSAIGSQRRSFFGADRFVRARWALGGTTPSFTFGISGEAV